MRSFTPQCRAFVLLAESSREFAVAAVLWQVGLACFRS
jgi:hypothetical protein